MDNTDTTLCPDCNSEIISVKRLNTKGKCELCERREKHSLKVNKPYIKVKDLPEIEKKAVLSRRQTMKNKITKNVTTNVTKKKRNNSKGSERKYSNELLQYSYDALNDGVNYETLFQMIKDEFGLEVTKKGLNAALWRFKNNKYKNKEEVKEKKEVKARNPIIKTTIINKDEKDLNNCNDTSVDTSVDINVDTIVDANVGDITLVKSETNDNINLKDSLLQQVDNVSNAKFVALNCKEPEKYTTDTYIKALEIIMDLCENRSSILEHRQKQHDIMNAYQNDVLHEVENADIENGDNTLLMKLKIVRNKRRYYEYDYNDVSILKTFLETVNLNKLKTVLGQLYKFKDIRENIVYKPNVDITMVDKYDWVVKTKTTNESDIKATKITSTLSEIRDSKDKCINANKDIESKFKQQFKPGEDFVANLITSQENIKNKSNKKVPVIKKYRVSCELSGGGYGTFKRWTREYTCLNEDLAKSFAEQEIQQIKTKNKGVLVTNFSVTQIPI